MNHVEAEKQRDVQACVFDRLPLQTVRFNWIRYKEHASGSALLQRRVRRRTKLRHCRKIEEQGELTRLLVRRHLRQQCIRARADSLIADGPARLRHARRRKQRRPKQSNQNQMALQHMAPC